MKTQPSPQWMQGAEIAHFSHPHPLVQVSFPYIFTCMGCKEYGAGSRFKCRNCDFDLHDFCALAPPSIQSHPLHSHHQLVFYTKPCTGYRRSKCDVCSKTSKGYAYRCNTCNFEMDPCCAKLSQEIYFPMHPHAMHLLPSTTLTSGDSGYMCGMCKRKRLGRAYGCRVCDYHLHAVCAKEMINGLGANGIKVPEKSNMLGSAARLASTAILDFFGGIIEGIGEGVGEALIDNIGRGAPNGRAIDK